MKKLIVILIVILIGLSACENKQEKDDIVVSNVKNIQDKHKTPLSPNIKEDNIISVKNVLESNTVLKYSNLPTKNDLSYFLNPTNIIGGLFSSISIRPINAKLMMRSHYAINSNVVGLDQDIGLKIDSSTFNEFEIDEFEKKLKKEYISSIYSMINRYKKTPNEIKIQDLNITVKYSKDEKGTALLKIKDTDIYKIKRLHASKSFNILNFINNVLANNYISKYIEPSNIELNCTARIRVGDYNDYNDNKRYEMYIKGNNTMINNIGKQNKGNDIITEITLKFLNAKRARTDITENFLISSFKLKSSNNRFVLKKHGFDNIYSIEDDNTICINNNIEKKLNFRQGLLRDLNEKFNCNNEYDITFILNKYNDSPQYEEARLFLEKNCKNKSKKMNDSTLQDISMMLYNEGIKG